MNTHIQEILKDIYEVDPALRQHEAELVILMEKMLASRPDSEFDAAFKERLKQELLERADELMAKSSSQAWWKEIFAPKSLAFAGVGAAIALVFVLPALLKDGKFIPAGKLGIERNQSDLAFETGVDRLSEKAFGSFWENQSQANPQNESISRSAAGFGGGGGAVSAPLAVADRSASSEEIGKADAKMIMPHYPEAIEYKYVYNGPDIDLNESAVQVYRQVKSQSSRRSLGSLLGGFDLGVVDLARFSGAEIKNINLGEDKEFGYWINVNFDESSFELYQNWERWPHPENLCRDEACFAQYRLKPEDVPADGELITIAKDFVSQLGIDLGNFDEPEVNNYWRTDYGRIPEQEAWVPEDMSIVFPLKINDQIVYDQGGAKSGLNVSVNIRQMKVSNLNSLKPYNFEESAYEAVTDREMVRKMIEKGGWQNYIYYAQGEQPAKTVEVTLGSPVRGLIRYYHYDEASNRTDELFIPSLIFPVENVSDNTGYFYRQSVVVPLVKEVFELDMNNNPVDPRPMPLIKGGAEPMIDLPATTVDDAETMTKN